MLNSPRPGPSFRVAAIFLVVLGFLLIACVAAGATLLFQAFLKPQASTTAISQPAPTITPFIPGNPALPPIISSGTPSISTGTPAVLNDTLEILKHANVPTINSVDVARRLLGIKNVFATIQQAPPAYKVGDKLEFWAWNDDTSAHFKVSTSLAYVSEHLYFWVQDSIRVDPALLQELGQVFEIKIYPTDRAFFGSEWTPGVDNDPHLYVVYTRGLASRTLGYFFSEDERNPAIDPYSNGHEMFVINANAFASLDESFYGVLAHEFQHMIEYNQHRDQEGWMNEGFSVLATFINKYGPGTYDTLFASRPDLQLNDFPNDQNKITPHYGAAFLFLDYFLSRFGEDTTRQLVKIQADGLEGVDVVLSQNGARDSVTGLPYTADDVFSDWAVTNYVNNPGIGDGRYAYSNYPAFPKIGDTEEISSCPAINQTRTVHQYGTDYIHIACRGNYTLTFQGASEVAPLPVDPHSGNYYFWSNKGDESDMTLTHTFDFSSVTGSISLSYWTWFDIEKNYDYVYLEASTDGSNWKILKTPSGTSENPGNNNLGFGYNGASNRWLNEKVDLSQYAGQKVELRFEYQTDSEVYGEGFLLDDVSIPQIGYQTDFETDDGGWVASGFVRIQNQLPQTYRLELIDLGSPNPTVQYLKLDPSQSLSFPLALQNDVVLVVSGSTRYIRQLAPYVLNIK